ncbi:MAG: hypothetical protein GY791_05115 [Alphaproteobacteria bacterium]|nr:hypothetical protein [Alphaproteobacteria bacterium]
MGDVRFGNIGVPERVSFSVIGPTANEVARLEALTKKLGRPVLATESFARNVAAKGVRLGLHKLRGVGEPIEVCAPAPPDFFRAQDYWQLACLVSGGNPGLRSVAPGLTPKKKRKAETAAFMVVAEAPRISCPDESAARASASR